MGLLVDGNWHDEWYDTKTSGGHFKREDAVFRNWVTSDGQAYAGNEKAEGGFKAEAGRYHLYVSYACPWAHRVLIFRKLKGLKPLIDVTAVKPLMLENGWEFSEPDPINGARYVWEIYKKAKNDYSGRTTVPILWDKQRETIVSNESSEIIRMFNEAFNSLTGNTLDFYPRSLRDEIDSINDVVYHSVNNGVYKAGFATNQEAYEEAVANLFETLNRLETRLEGHRYLVGDRLTEADWRLFTTLIRFDPVYVGHFKCNIRRIADYPALSAYMRELYQMPGIAETVDFDVIKTHYYGSHKTINPTGVIPVGPAENLMAPHGRDHLRAVA